MTSPTIIAVVIPSMGEKYGRDDFKGYCMVAAGTPTNLDEYLQMVQFKGLAVKKMSVADACALTGYSFSGW